MANNRDFSADIKVNSASEPFFIMANNLYTTYRDTPQCFDEFENLCHECVVAVSNNFRFLSFEFNARVKSQASFEKKQSSCRLKDKAFPDLYDIQGMRFILRGIKIDSLREAYNSNNPIPQYLVPYIDKLLNDSDFNNNEDFLISLRVKVIQFLVTQFLPNSKFKCENILDRWLPNKKNRLGYSATHATLNIKSPALYQSSKHREYPFSSIYTEIQGMTYKEYIIATYGNASHDKLEDKQPILEPIDIPEWLSTEEQLDYLKNYYSKSDIDNIRKNVSRKIISAHDSSFPNGYLVRRLTDLENTIAEFEYRIFHKKAMTPDEFLEFLMKNNIKQKNKERAMQYHLETTAFTEQQLKNLFDSNLFDGNRFNRSLYPSNTRLQSTESYEK